MNTQIDSFDGIDISKLAFSDIRIKFGTGSSKWISGSGRDKKYIYRIGCLCHIIKNVNRTPTNNIGRTVICGTNGRTSQPLKGE